MTSKTIPPATVAIIDPESGTSSGGGTTDVKVGVGDVILFRFKYFPVPDKIVRGLQGYLTEYLPANTQVVGVRIIDENGLTIPPRYPGLSDNGCARGCNGFNAVPWSGGTRNLDDGSISQVYADTGIFYAGAPAVVRNPGNQFLTITNGITMSPAPQNIGAITGLLGATSPVFSHNAWDWTQVRAYGISNAQGNFSGNSGSGNTPFLYGSPVAGPDTFYRYEATEVSPGVVQFNDVVGPWNRIRYPGSQIGSGAAVTTTGSLRRMNIDTTGGLDLTPANPLPAATKAVRIALGEVRVGEPGFAEIALRVTGTPLDPTQGKDVDCAEVFGGDTAAASDTVRGRDNAWPTYLASPACVFLNLLFDLDVDKPLAGTGDVLTYTLHGKNLSVNTQSGAVAKLKYDGNDVSYVGGSATGGATLVSNCDGDGKACLVWPAMTLLPSAEYTFTAQFTVGGGGHVTNVMFANYRSTQLPAPGFTTQALTVVRDVSVARITLQAAPLATAGAATTFTGTVQNIGSGDGSFSTLTIVLPTGWTVSPPVVLGGATLTCASNCATDTPTYTIGTASFAAGESRALTFSANVPGGAATGLYSVDLEIWGSQSMFGGGFETYFPRVATVAVGSLRSPAPTVRCPITSKATSIGGTTTEPDGTTIRLYFNALPRGSATSTGGGWMATNFAGFGALYGGLEVRATAQASGKLESILSEPCFVSVTPACSDGADNDGDGLIDFPADPGCDSPVDSSEGNPVLQCSDGLDNDSDTFTDFPADLSCSDRLDPTEAGPPACSDGVDNDGDGLTDFSADPGCTSANDPNEISFPACSDGLDNDGDGKVDFPADLGCHSGNDDDERDGGFTSSEIKPRLLLAFDTSGSMNWTTCNSDFTGGDGSLECGGSDVACVQCGASSCGDGRADDSRLYKVKNGISDVVRAFGEVDYGLMRFHQRAEAFACPTSNASMRSGGWQGSVDPPCGGGFSAGDLLVSFDPDNHNDLLQWMDGKSNYSGTPPPGLDTELRGTGTTPLAGILGSALDELQKTRAGDAQGACRPYRVILVTDGAESCGGDPATAAAQLLAAGVKVYVIGFATPDPNIKANLNSISAAGGTGSAILVDDSVSLSAAIASIITDSILVERCNEKDDDCDGLADEDFPGKGTICENGQAGACLRTAVRQCSADGLGTVCNAPPATPGKETCPANGADDDCNGIVDDVPGGCGTCTPEVCNGRDDDCDGTADELSEIFPCPTGAASPANCQCPSGRSCGNVTDLPSCWCPGTCGTVVGECRPGVLVCSNGRPGCSGATGPTLEVCDGKDNDCDTAIDGFTRACYPTGTAGCTVATGVCLGICRVGIETCPRLIVPAASNAFTACSGAITPQKEICNKLDDDCNGIVDDVPTGCDKICIPSAELCNGRDDNCNGIVDDMPAGEGDACVDAFDAAKVGVGGCRAGRKRCVAGVLRCEGQIGPQPEICDGKDNNCDGNPDVGAPCPTNFTCIDGACQPGCNATEFPCTADRRCVDPATRELCARASNVGCSCLPNACLDASCARDRQDCVIAKGIASCVDRCPVGKCAAPTTCEPSSGRCVDCRTTGCPAGQLCLGAPGTCRPDLCAGVTCDNGQFCQDGTCRPVCSATTCPAGQTCVAGACRVSKCETVACTAGKICNPDTGACDPNPCQATACLSGDICVSKSGACVPDPCQTTHCPNCTVCKVGFAGTADCVSDMSCQRVLVAQKGGGCTCEVGEAGTPPWTGLTVVLALGLGLRRSRRRGRL